VPDGKLEAFERIIQDYLEEKRTRDGTKSLDHKALVNTIQEVRAATFDALWTDDPSVLPADETLSIWWEIWRLSEWPAKSSPSGRSRGTNFFRIWYCVCLSK
jgi:hypothetical protein